ncbi:MAG: TetR/AcrR family transcriptional regulator [Acidimicrobiales bacterium]
MASPASTTAARTTRPSADGTRDRILAAALDLFSERSFEGATTREIAARAGVTQPLLNYHFRSKEYLWQASVDRLFGELDRALSARVEGLRGVDELSAAKLVVREFIYFSAAHPQLHRIMMQECKVDGTRIDWLVDRHIRPLYEMTAALFSRLVELGRVPAVPATNLYYVITGAAATIFVLAPECRRLGGFDPLERDAVEVHADVVTRLLFGPGEDGTSR